jgi:hypothetical protein
MKIEGPNKTSGAKGVSKSGAKRTGDGAFDSMVGDAEESEAASSAGRPTSIGALDALLSLQEAESGTSEEAQKKARKRAGDLLDHLDKIKIGLLTGELPKSALQHLAQTITSHRDHVLDPKLAEILDEIDLRAQVELAKLEA